MRTSVSSFKRLKALPEVFTDKTFMRLSGTTMSAASVTLHRWKRAEFIAPAGDRVGVFFNLVRNPDAQSERLMDALKMVFPSAILRGESVLHAAGWITQIPSAISIAVLKRRSYPAMDNFAVAGRDIEWFKLVHGDLVRPSQVEWATYGLDALPPALALADLYLTKGDWHPDIDDLDIPDEAWPEVARAFIKLGLSIPEQYRAAVAEHAGAGDIKSLDHQLKVK